MSRRSDRLTLQARDSNAAEPAVREPLKKRKSEPSKKKLQPAAKKQNYEIQRNKTRMLRFATPLRPIH
ncbi:hypothetical protein ILYODFUR_031169 [Ilyodon furcidens]|uniref:Uncharacterized protein n=1 Tax=Ilyodon furcidens TaxID=33524 RepID=A0ABV0TED1_9TELE